MTESRDDKAEHDYGVERDIAALAGIVDARVEMDCDACGLSIHVGDPVSLGPTSWLHPVCAAEYQADLDAERAHDMRREG